MSWNPKIDDRTGQIWNRIPGKDLFWAVIYDRIDDQLYVKTVQATGAECEDGRATVKLATTLHTVIEIGPNSCHLIEDGGLLPEPD